MHILCAEGIHIIMTQNALRTSPPVDIGRGAMSVYLYNSTLTKDVDYNIIIVLFISYLQYGGHIK